MKNLLVRALSGLVYVGLIVGCLFLGYREFALLGVVFAALGSLELTNVAWEGRGGSDTARRWLNALMCMVMVCIPLWPKMMLAWLLLMLARMILEILSCSRKPIESVGLWALEQLWIGLPLACGVWIAMQDTMTLLAIFIFVWLNDTGAYLVGSQIGKRRLAPKLSPKKSWEGFFGGLFFCVAFGFVAALCCRNFFGDLPLWQWIIVAVCACLLSTFGDLFESMIKRAIGVKDTSQLIPGHGGILDRIDSMLFVMPGLLLCLMLFYLL